MSGFIFIAALLTFLVLGAVLFPLLRSKGETPAAWRMAGITIVVVVAGAVALYPLWSTWDWDRPAPAADSPEGMVSRLSRRLATEQDDLQGWLLLGKSYSTLGQLGEEQGQQDYALAQYSRAARAYQRVDNMTQGTNRDALIGLGEALVAMDRESLGGRAGQLFEKALKQDPHYVKALLYSAFAAAKRNDFPLARSRFQKLLDGNPPPEVRSIIDTQIAQLDTSEKMAAMAAAPPADVVTVSLHVTLAPAVAAKGNAGAPLFVLARIPGQRGPPLAAKRLDAKFPQDVELLSTDAMIAGSGFTAGQEIEVEARIANGGSAISRSGDPFGVARIKAGAGGRTSIEINQLKP
jgi:cytochrome c-type biogenesis protein CcmH